MSLTVHICFYSTFSNYNKTKINITLQKKKNHEIKKDIISREDGRIAEADEKERPPQKMEEKKRNWAEVNR